MAITKIIHHAATANMGDVTQEWADEYRTFIRAVIKNRCHNAEVWVVDGEYNDIVTSDNYDENTDEVKEFLCELWEKYGR
jgi:hypothetical protein